MAHIVVIDDDEQFRTMLVQMLTQDGHQVSIATDGEEGLDLVARVRPDLIITDILMPNMDGLGVLIELERMHMKIPVIAVSGGCRSLSSKFNLETAILLGAQATLTKPFTRAELRSALVGFLTTPCES